MIETIPTGAPAAACRRSDAPRLLAIGPALDGTSYSRVTHGTLAPLASTWNVLHLGINYRGEPVDAGCRIVPNRVPGDRYAIRDAVALTKSFRPDAIFILNSFLSLPRYRQLPELLGPDRPPLVAQCPLLGEATDPRLVARLAFFDVVVVLSQRVRRHFSDAFDECLRNGWVDRVPHLEVIPHGFDAALFHPVPRDEARDAFGLPNDAFIVLNANRNERRKHVEVTLEAFARFARDKRVWLYLHMGDNERGDSIRDSAQRLGIGDRVILANARRGGHPHLTDRELNLLYNACDVGVNTASSEGWGMVSFEHAATGAAQIVPASWVCGEIWQDHAELAAAAEAQAPQSGPTREVMVDPASVAAALERLYRDPRHRESMRTRAAQFARRDEFQWSSIAARWDEVLNGGRLPRGAGSTWGGFHVGRVSTSPGGLKSAPRAEPKSAPRAN